MQLKHFLDVPSRREGFTKPTTILESLCSRTAPRTMSYRLYASLFEELSVHLHSEHSYWESTVGTEMDKEGWDRINLYIHKGSLNVSIQENGYKLKTRWYRTPDLIHKFSPLVSKWCWRCGGETGTFLHICGAARPSSHYGIKYMK